MYFKIYTSVDWDCSMKINNIRFISIFLSILTIMILLFTNTLVACSGFAVHEEDLVLIAHNKDWWTPETSIHIYPARDDAHARLFFEIPFPHPFNNDYRVLAGGVNDQGLCYESFVTPFNPASFKLFKPPLFKNPVDYLLQQYTTVEEVIEYIESHNLFFLNYILSYGQLFVVDATGDAAIIEGDDIIRINDGYQICTNFLQSNPDKGNYPCWRYEYLTSELEHISDPSISYFTSLLENVELFAQYSWILNPINLTLNIYHFHYYERCIVLDLNEEFNQPAHSYELATLFEPVDNTPPEKPNKPTGPSSGKRKETLTFTTNTTDVDNNPDAIYYQWDFGDNMESTWIYNYQTYRGIASHQFKIPGTYQVRVKAKDIYGKESPWSDALEIQITFGRFTFLSSILDLI